MLNANRLQSVHRQRLEQIKSLLNSFHGQYIKVNIKIAHMVMAFIDQQIGRDNRLSLLSFMFNRPIYTSADLQIEELRGLIEWADPAKIEDEWSYSAQIHSDLGIIKKALGIHEHRAVMCRLCNHGRIRKIQPSKDFPKSPTSGQVIEVTCKCCNGHYTDCKVCAIT